MTLQSPSEPPMLNFVRVLFRHKKKVAAFFLVCVVCAVAVILFSPRTYRSEAKMFIRIGRESISLDPTATTGQTVMMEKSQESEINSVLEVLNSRQIAAHIVDRVGPDVLLETHIKQNPVVRFFADTRAAVGQLLDSMSSSADGASGGPPDDIPTVDEELAMIRLARRLEVYAPKNSTVITIAYEAGSPQLARTVARAAIDTFIEAHLRLNRTKGSFDFFVEQTGHLEEQLLDLQRRLQERKNEFGLITVEGKRKRLEEKLHDVELAQLIVDRDVTLTETKVNELKAAADSMDKEIITETVSGYANMARDRMREQLYQFEIHEKGLVQLYTPSHPLVISAQEQREALEAILNEQPSDRSQTTTSLNPTRQSLELDLESQEVSATASLALQKLLDQQKASVEAELVQLNRQEIELARLQRNVELAEVNYRIHAEKLEQARIDTELQQDLISNVNVVQQPSYVRKPVHPKKPLILAAGILIGVLGGCGIALAAEAMDGTLRSTEQTEAHLGVPVLLSVPASDRTGRSRATTGGAQYGSS